MAVRLSGLAPVPPGAISFTSFVEAGVPSVVHNSSPVVLVDALKKVLAPTAQKREGELDGFVVPDALISLTRVA